MWKRIIIITIASLITLPAMAKRQRKLNSAQDEKTPTTEVVEVSTDENLWHKGVKTVVQLKGQASEDSARCKTFQVKLADQLEYKIECVGQEMAETLELKSVTNRTVTQKGEHLTITEYGYLMKKPSVGKGESSTLKVPFVEKIIHIKKLPDGEMAFYFETFKEDEFGRIVQDSFVQAHSLTNKKMKISKN